MIRHNECFSAHKFQNPKSKPTEYRLNKYRTSGNRPVVPMHTHIHMIIHRKFDKSVNCKCDKNYNIQHMNGKFDYENKKKIERLLFMTYLFRTTFILPSLFIYKAFSYSNNCFLFVCDFFLSLHRNCKWFL